MLLNVPQNTALVDNTDINGTKLLERKFPVFENQIVTDLLPKLFGVINCPMPIKGFWSEKWEGLLEIKGKKTCFKE